MKVSFDQNIKIGGIGLVPWTRLGPEIWLNDYKIASLYGWDLGQSINNPVVMGLSEVPNLKRQNTQNLLETQSFQKLLTDNFSGYSMMTYKPVKVSDVLQESGVKFLRTNQQLAARLENKAEFREIFTPLEIPFPSYKIIDADAPSAPEDFGGKSKLAVQDSVLSGGKGTRIVTSQAELVAAIADFTGKTGGRKIVISDFIENGRERTVQCCVTKYGVMVGPLQKQIVADPLLSNLSVKSADKFCGAEISSADELAGAYPEIKALAIKIGEKMQAMGYKGIFGLDCLIAGDGKVYVLEVNPRITGVTPLLTMLYRQDQDIPFYLLHILELGGFDYKIDNFDVNPIAPEGGLMLLHSQNQDTVRIDSSPKSGLYRMPDQVFIKDAIRFDEASGKHDWLVQQYPPGYRVQPGGRIITALTSGRILDSRDKLLDETVLGVNQLLGQIKTSRIT